MGIGDTDPNVEPQPASWEQRLPFGNTVRRSRIRRSSSLVRYGNLLARRRRCWFCRGYRALAIRITSKATIAMAWIHAAATLAVVAAGFALRVERVEWLALMLAIMAVWTAESLNTAFEFLCDVASPEFHPTPLEGTPRA